MSGSSGTFIAVAVACFVIGGLIGSAIGKSKDRAVAGFWLGALLTWIGWIIVAVMEPSAAERERRQRELAGLISGQPGDRRPCPSCAELIMYEAVVCRFCGGSVPAAPPAHPVQSAVVGLRDEKEWAIGTDETGAPQLIKVAKSFVTIRSTVDIRKPARKWTTEPIRDLLAVTFDETTNQLVIESRSRTFTFRADDPAEGRKLSRQINLIRVTGNP